MRFTWKNLSLSNFMIAGVLVLFLYCAWKLLHIEETLKARQPEAELENLPLNLYKKLSPEESKALYEEGNKLFNAGKYAEAELFFKEKYDETEDLWQFYGLIKSQYLQERLGFKKIIVSYNGAVLLTELADEDELKAAAHNVLAHILLNINCDSEKRKLNFKKSEIQFKKAHRIYKILHSNSENAIDKRRYRGLITIVEEGIIGLHLSMSNFHEADSLIKDLGLKSAAEGFNLSSYYQYIFWLNLGYKNEIKLLNAAKLALDATLKTGTIYAKVHARLDYGLALRLNGDIEKARTETDIALKMIPPEAAITFQRRIKIQELLFLKCRSDETVYTRLLNEISSGTTDDKEKLMISWITKIDCIINTTEVKPQ